LIEWTEYWHDCEELANGCGNGMKNCALAGKGLYPASISKPASIVHEIAADKFVVLIFKIL